ncbi:TolC family protein [bacterium]|nr:TolC family protein [bacterium]
MRRRTTASALAAVALFTGLSVGQPPAPPKAIDPTDALIQKALANDPDVQVARAKLALAEAEVAKARQASVTRVITLRDTVEQQRQAVGRLVEKLSFVEKAAKQGGASREDLLVVQEQVASARAALERAEIELRLLTGDGPKAAAGAGTGLRIHIPPLGPLPPDQDPEVIRMLTEMIGQGLVRKGPSGLIPDRIRSALDVKVRLGNKGDGISLDAAMEVFKREAGLDVSIRPTPSPMPRIVLAGEELPVGAWFQMFQDHGGQRDGFAFYVREYGLLVAYRQTAPPDAMTLTEFWRARPVAAPQPAAKRVDFAHDNLPAVLKAKAGGAIAILLPVKRADVESAKATSDNPSVEAFVIGSTGDTAAILIRSDRPGTARVSWAVTDQAGRRFAKDGQPVEFE